MNEPLVLLRRSELVELIREAVIDAVAELNPPEPPTLWDKNDTAAFLRVSTRTVDTLRRTRGLPTRWVGDSPRFDPAEVDAWLKQQPGPVQP